MKILTIVGARPQFVKCAAVSKLLRNKFEEIIVHTGQHYDNNMSDAFFRELNIPEPNYNLEVGSGKPGWQIANIMLKLEQILYKEKPKLVLVYGDTNSTIASALVAAKNNILVAHIEAGLREFNKQVPEELNKIVTDAVSDFFFVPTQTGINNLKNSNIIDNVYLVGDVGLDLIVNNMSEIENNKKKLLELGLKEKEYYFATCHREINTTIKENLESIIDAMNELDYKTIFPLHPRTRKAINDFGLEKKINTVKILLIDPIGFIDTQTLLRNAKMALTDSGGIIKEAYFHKTPAIIIDTQSEWMETINEGWNIIAGPDKLKILSSIKNYKIPHNKLNSLGDGTAALKIVTILENYFYNEK